MSSSRKINERLPFRALGHTGDRYYFLPDRGGVPISLTASNMGRVQSFLPLAPLSYWWDEFSIETKSGSKISIIDAAEFLISLALQAGIYDPSRMRGRGAWIDRGRIVMHCGDRLLVDGSEQDILTFDSDYIYEARPRVELSLENALNDAEALRFRDLCDSVTWQKSLHGVLFAGWCVLAPVCGALNWRPHIWITGASGAGKTWVMDNLLRCTVGNMAVNTQGESTEAGLRQTLQTDARPVLFDEAEGEVEKAQNRIQSIILMARASSSDTEARIIKGSAGGNPDQYAARAAFAFASINVQLARQADKSRVSVLGLLPPVETDDLELRASIVAHFAYIENEVAELLTDDFADRHLARCINLLPVIRANAETFSKVLVNHVGDSRLGQQLGTLLGASQTLKDPEPISAEAATILVERLDFSEYIQPTEDRDEIRLLNHLLQQQPMAPRQELAIGELIAAVAGAPSDDSLGHNARESLKRLGIRVQIEDQIIMIANNHVELARMLHGTPWAVEWRRVLQRLPGASAAKTSVRFSSGVKERATAVPFSAIPGLIS